MKILIATLMLLSGALAHAGGWSSSDDGVSSGGGFGTFVSYVDCGHAQMNGKLYQLDVVGIGWGTLPRFWELVPDSRFAGGYSTKHDPNFLMLTCQKLATGNVLFRCEDDGRQPAQRGLIEIVREPETDAVSAVISLKQPGESRAQLVGVINGCRLK